MSTIDAEALYRVLLDQIRAAYGTAFAEPGGPRLAGIYSGGAWLAERLARDLGAPAFGVVNVALHHDDYAKKGLHSQASPTSLPFEVDSARIVLVDDVLYTGRTVRAALNELFDYGRPAAVELAVLADRGGLDPSHEKKRVKAQRTLDRANAFDPIAREWHEQKTGAWSE
ncbi:bifunctional pyr operon transcriptional regulator/uracil phosphoribosyltransferase PyrR, partial [Burkholderia sp. Ac-20345]|uniref:bifunctional pyr operon transcriptional regulator/uracil phosphoribosyltransferase PyrR n=1 Tax=Burkholderia sp. Ac-20345 TaxID=2703891 RepID=UPI00197BFC69